MRFCIFCGITIPKDAKYCQICSKEQPTAEEVPAPSPDTAESEEPIESATGIAKLLPQSPVVRIAIGVGIFLVLIALFSGVLIMAMK